MLRLYDSKRPTKIQLHRTDAENDICRKEREEVVLKRALTLGLLGLVLFFFNSAESRKPLKIGNTLQNEMLVAGKLLAEQKFF